MVVFQIKNEISLEIETFLSGKFCFNFIKYMRRGQLKIFPAVDVITGAIKL